MRAAAGKATSPHKATDNSAQIAAQINSTEGLAKGSRVWYKQDATTWVPAELRSAPADQCSIRLDSGKELTVSRREVVPANPKLQEGITALTNLTYLNEPGILHNLQYRYSKGQIYTFAGPVLIALNPCKNLPLYTPEVAVRYKEGAREYIHNLEPHIYLVAANAFRDMVREGAPQSLLVTGESGAGKTETTKKAMQYFATLAGGTGVEDQVLETNPILEAFGNAKTLRNHNSSRFGKLIQIHFNQSHKICGATIKTYLLEKSRVVFQLKGERSYHIFYQLVKGATAEERTKFRLPKHPKDFKFLAQSGCTDIDGMDDVAEYKQVKRSLADIGIDAASQDRLFSLLSGIMWLGNLEFVPNPKDDSTSVRAGEALTNAAALLGTTPEGISAALTQKKIRTPEGPIVTMLSAEASRDTRDALAKAVYAAMFNWIVEQINIKLDVRRQQSGLYIAILDIYGFEQFQRNSFEQLCINYANERLQQQFTRHLFKLEQSEYEAEGIDWTKVEFVDNQDCVDVIEMVPPRGLGVMAVLDSQCKFPKATDETLVIALKEALGGAAHFQTNPRSPLDFTIVHYAGEVQYDSSGFLDKNKDTLNGDLVEMMTGSKHGLLPAMGKQVSDDLDKKRGGQTVGMRFSSQLKELITMLDTTGLHFVRCIKPNWSLVPDKFEQQLVLHQLRCCGVLEVARIARAGFPTRYLHAQFAERYKILLPPELQKAVAHESATQAVHHLLALFKLDATQYQVGRTKVFFRPGALGSIEDQWMRMQTSATRIQAKFRMYVARKRFLTQRSAALTMQSLYRVIFYRKAYVELRNQDRAARVIQRTWAAHRIRQSYLKLRWAATVLAMAWRWRYFCKRVKRRRIARDKKELMDRLEQESFNTIRKTYGMDLAEVRNVLGMYKANKLVTVEKLEELKAKAAAAPPPATPPPAAAPAPAPVAAPAPTVSGGDKPRASGDLAVSRDVADLAADAAMADSTASPRSADLLRLQMENLKLQKQVQLEKQLRERYSAKLEQQAMDWVEQVQILQDYIAQVRTAVGDDALPPVPSLTPAKGGPPGVQSARGTPGVAYTAVGAAAGGQHANGGTSPIRVRQPAEMSHMTPANKYVAGLNNEVAKITNVLSDDIQFISEVVDGNAEAPDMDPTYELNKLKKKFEIWKGDFKGKLETAERILVRLAEQQARTPGGATKGRTTKESYFGGGSATKSSPSPASKRK